MKTNLLALSLFCVLALASAGCNESVSPAGPDASTAPGADASAATPPDAGNPLPGADAGSGPDASSPADAGGCASPACTATSGACIQPGTCDPQPGQKCSAGALVSSCGDNVCNCLEDAVTCPDDCATPCQAPRCTDAAGACVIEGTCGAQPRTACSAGSFSDSCGNFLCDCGETNASCAADCPSGCGAQDCPEPGGNCVAAGSCGPNDATVCRAGSFVSSCGNTQCDCNEAPDTCASDCCQAPDCLDGQGGCVPLGECGPAAESICGPAGVFDSSCGDTRCNCGETPTSCPTDCNCLPDQCSNGQGGCLDHGACYGQAGISCNHGTIGLSCGDGVCNCGETSQDCGQDCGCLADACLSGGLCIPAGQCDQIATLKKCDGTTTELVTSCGDGACSQACGESCSNCTDDCGSCATGGCGNGTCDTAEDCTSCPQDCDCVTCGAPSATCAAPEVCCLNFQTGAGSCSASTCTSALRGQCDGPEDCDAGSICCGRLSGVACLAPSACTGTFNFQVCHSPADCQDATKPVCQACTLMGLTMTVCTDGGGC